MKRALTPVLWFGALILWATSTRADQPVFNEMPRWDGGWGVQLVHEYRSEDHLLLKDRKAARDFTETVELLHLEGVYTWDKAIRLTVKIPYVLDAERELPSPAGKILQRDEGVGDITAALPLKKYFNLSRRSGSWTLAPQLRIPTSGDDAYEVYDHEWGLGLGAGYETETHLLAFGAGAGVWTYLGREPLEASANLDLGSHFILGGMSGSLKWENDLAYENDGSTSLTYLAGPALYVRVTDLLHLRCSWKHDFYDRQGTLDHGEGDRFTAGAAMVF